MSVESIAGAENDVIYRNLSRRDIYFNRLVGDGVFLPKAQTRRKSSLPELAVFLLFTSIATLVIVQRAQVGTLSAVTSAMQTYITRMTWQSQSEWTANPSRVLADVSSVNDIRDFSLSFIKAISTTLPFENPLSVLLFSRVTPLGSSCLNTSSVLLTIRRVDLNSDATSTTSRFKTLFPKTWAASGIVSTTLGGATGEATNTLKSDGVEWKYQPSCTLSCSSGDLSRGYKNRGGYVALVSISNTAGTFVHLVDNVYGNNSALPAKGICGAGEFPRNQTISLEKFFQSSFIDAQMTALVMEFMVYNPNYQSLSRVLLSFDITALGAMDNDRRIAIPSSVEVDTILLQVSRPNLQFVELAYLILILGYFVRLFYKISQGGSQYLKDPWIYLDAVSLICALIALLVWYIYESSLKNILDSNAWGYSVSFEVRYYLLQTYIRASAFAVWTNYLRVLQVMSSFSTRVEILLSVLVAAIGSSIRYIAYIIVIFLGFTVVSFVMFGPMARSYYTWPGSIVSLLGMWVGDDSTFYGANSFNFYPLKEIFYVCFVYFFAIVSLQLFNAICNYSYNSIKEDTQGRLDRELQDSRRKDQQRKEHPILTQLKKWMPAWLGNRAGGKAGGADSEAEKQSKPDSGAAGPSAAAAAAIGGDAAAEGDAGAEDEEEMKKKANAASGEESQSTVSTGPLAILFWAVFAISYVYFMDTNLSVTCKRGMFRAMTDAIATPKVAVPIGGFGGTKSVSWADIDSSDQAVYWMLQAVPAIFYPPAKQPANSVFSGIGGAPLCIKTWNCLLNGTFFNGTGVGGRKILRLTIRQGKLMNNTGGLISSAGGPAATSPFTGGTDPVSGLPVSQVLAPSQSLPSSIDPGSPLGPGELDYSSIKPVVDKNTGATICKVTTPGAPGSFGKAGGIACQLDADQASFASQLRQIGSSGLLAPVVSTYSFDFVVYNTNSELLDYVAFHLILGPSGLVDNLIEDNPVVLFDMGNAVNRLSVIIIRLLPGAIFIILVVSNAIMILTSLRKEQLRRRERMQAQKSDVEKQPDLTDRNKDSGSNFFRTALEVVSKNPLVALELISVMISLTSAALFFLTLRQSTSFQQVMGGDFDGLLQFAADLQYLDLLYKRVSAINMIVMFVRPIAFFKGSPRVAAITSALFDGLNDIFLFVLILIAVMAGFCMLVYVSFGPYISDLAEVLNTFNYCFGYLFGSGQPGALQLFEIDVLMATIFVFPFTLIMFQTFACLFFGIIDRFYVPVTPPPFNFKRALKPVFKKIFKCIEWDDDYVLDQDVENTQGPPTRRNRVASLKRELKEIQALIKHDPTGQAKVRAKGVLLGEVEIDTERLTHLVTWSVKEAKELHNTLISLQGQKLQANPEKFSKILDERLGEVEADVRLKMEEKKRDMQYATEVHERTASNDQAILSRYVLILEHRIREKLKEKHALSVEVSHLIAESKTMQFQDDEDEGAPSSKAQALDQGPQEASAGE